jgi:hypothetical protein
MLAACYGNANGQRDKAANTNARQADYRLTGVVFVPYFLL